MIVEEPRVRREMTCCRNIFCKLGILPLTFSLGAILTLIITYSVSVARGDVYPFWPTISDTGGAPPESNIFGLFLSGCAFLGFTSVVVRYYQYRFISESNEEHRRVLICMNKLSMCVGTVSTSGALLVAAFQDRGVSLNMHIVGALLVFGFGVLYTFMQTYLSYKMLACGMNSKRLFATRLFIAMCSLISFIGQETFQNLAGQARNKDPPTDPKHDIPHWYPEDAGFAYNVAGTSCEWLMGLSFFVYFLTFVGEFNKVKMNFSIKSEDFSMLIPFQTSNDSEENQDYVNA